MSFGAFVVAVLWGVVCAVIGGLATRAYLRSKGKLRA